MADTAQQRPLRVVHIISSLQVGGMEQFALRLAARQRERGAEATILALNGGPLLDRAREFGVPVQVLGGRHVAARVAGALLYYGRSRPDIIHGHNPTSLHYATLAKRVSPARVIMTYHGAGAGHPREPSAAEWRSTDAVVAVSGGAVPQLRRPEVGDRLRVILNGVDLPSGPTTREMTRKELGLDGRIVGIVVARMDGMKGHDTLLSAFASPAVRDLPLTVLFAGDGAERPELERRAKELGLAAEHVRFLGFRQDVGRLLEASDLFLLPSRTEGLPLSLLEAMAHGLPVIATPVGGIPEVVRAGCEGKLVSVDNDSELGEAIVELCRNSAERERMGMAARTRVAQQFSFDAMTDAYAELYRSLLS